MPRLIDADALLDKLQDKRYAIRPATVAAMFQREQSFMECMSVVIDAPTIDAEPVTRCNMCKYYEAEVGFCHYHDHGMHWDDFCSRCAKMDLEVQDGS